MFTVCNQRHGNINKQTGYNENGEEIIKWFAEDMGYQQNRLQCPASK